MTLTKVPPSYLGTWRRTFLEHAGVKDTSTFVLWLQTEQYHADIRIPAYRPTFDSMSHLEDCSIDQLTWLATQQGFTGITQINGHTVEWIRDHDFQPSNGQRDIGEMKFEADDILIEDGVAADYQERWERVPNSQLNLSVQQIFSKNRHAQIIPARLFTSNSTFAFVRPRDKQLPSAASMSAAINDFKPNKEALLDWLDFEITFGEIIDEHYGFVTHSTFPFREGKKFKLM